MQTTATESELLQASLAGDKEAFGSIVERYQFLICAITYSATGDFAASRQIARQTFIRAWSSLAQLKDPDNFRPWLCRIARNLVSKSMRKRRFDVIHDPESVKPPESDAGQVAISEERQVLVWQALQKIPEQYREPVVFFYQRQPSAAPVAADLDLSEQALMQRVSEARSLLKTEVAAFVQDVLAKTAPGEPFTQAVLTALTKPSHPDQGPSPDRSRKARPEPGRSRRRASAGAEESALTSQTQDRTSIEYQPLPVPAKMSQRAVYGAFAGGIFGGVAWLLPTSFMAKDWPAAAIVLIIAGLICLVSTTWCLRDQTKRWRILGWVMIALCALNLSVINLRWSRWMQAYQEDPSYNAPTNLSRWTMNIIIAAIMAALLLIFLTLDSRQRKQTTEPPQAPYD